MVADINAHGGDIYSYIIEKGELPLDYSANINPLGLPKEVKKAFLAAADKLCSYPDVTCRGLRKLTAQYEGCREEELLFGNGAADLIYRICFALKPKKALLLAPTFSEYGQALQSLPCDLAYFHLKPETDFMITQEILPLINGKEILFLCNPNNPTGRVIDPALLYQIAMRCEEENCILVIDECFMDFVAGKEKLSFQKYLSQFKQVIILKAFTKIFAMPGLRLGYLMSSNHEVIKKIQAAGQAWSVSVPTQAAGEAALQEKEYLNRTIKLITKERNYLIKALKQLGFTVFFSDTNFILFQTEEKYLYQKLYQKGILIRRCENFKGLDNTYYRIAVKRRKDNQKLISAIKEVRKHG